MMPSRISRKFVSNDHFRVNNDAFVDNKNELHQFRFKCIWCHLHLEVSRITSLVTTICGHPCHGHWNYFYTYHLEVDINF